MNLSTHYKIAGSYAVYVVLSGVLSFLSCLSFSLLVNELSLTAGYKEL